MTESLQQTTPGKKRVPVKSLVLTVLLLAWSVLLGTFLYVSQFIRLMADDFCYLTSFHQYGFWGAQQQIYLTWAGRYADHFLIGLSSLGAPENTLFLPVILMIAWLFGFWLLARLALQRIGITNTALAALVIAVIIESISILIMPNRFQTIYWVNGGFPYGWPMVFWTWLTWWCWRMLSRGKKFVLWEVIVAVVLTFFAAGLSESAATVQTGLVGMIWFYSIAIQKKKHKPAILLLSGLLLVTGLGLAVMALAPGNQVRAGQMTNHVGILSGLLYAFQYGFDFLVYQIRGYLLPLCVVSGELAFLVLLLRYGHIPNGDKKPSVSSILFEMIIPVVFVYLAFVALSVPFSLVEGAYPEDRAWGMGAWIITVLFAYLGGYWGYRLPAWLPELYKRRWLIPLCSFCFVFIGIAYPLRAAWNLRSYVQDRQSYATAYDIRQPQVETAAANGNVNLTINALQSQFGVSDLSNDPTNWANVCMADFYGLESITGQ